MFNNVHIAMTILKLAVIGLVYHSVVILVELQLDQVMELYLYGILMDI